MTFLRIREIVARMSRQQEIVLKHSTSPTNDLTKDNLPRLVTNVVKKERDASQSVVPALISQEFIVHAPKIIEELFMIHIQNTVLNVHPTTSSSTTSTFDLQQQIYLKMKYDAFHKRDHDDQPGYDASQEGEKSAKSTVINSTMERFMAQKIVQDQAKKRRANPEEVFSDHKIVEVVRVTSDKQY
ncbi:hypothetical protein Tco_1484731 [Tanacetum coccineum]